MIPLKDDIPTDRPALVTYLLIAVNVIAYLLAIRHGGSLWSGPTAEVSVHYGAIPYELSHRGAPGRPRARGRARSRRRS
jgi:hypothetical protein